MIPDGAIGETTSRILRQHKVHKTQFDMIKACDDALKQKILAAFNNDYVEGVANANFGLTQTTKLKVLNHL